MHHNGFIPPKSENSDDQAISFPILCNENEIVENGVNFGDTFNSISNNSNPISSFQIADHLTNFLCETVESECELNKGELESLLNVNDAERDVPNTNASSAPSIHCSASQSEFQRLFVAGTTSKNKECCDDNILDLNTCTAARNIFALQKKLNFPWRKQPLLQWKNEQNLCWLDVMLQSVANSVTVRAAINHEMALKGSMCNSIFFRLCEIYDNVQTQYYDLTTLKDDFAEIHYNQIQLLLVRLKSIQMEIYQLLKTKCLLQSGCLESVVEMFPNLLKLDPTIENLFKVDCRWEFQCNACHAKLLRRSSTSCLSFPSTMPSFHPLNAAYKTRCSKCKAEDQSIHVVLERLPPCLFMHFQSGLTHSRFQVLDFGIQGCLFSVVAIIQYVIDPFKHFVVWIHDCITNQWLCSDDLKDPACDWSKLPPRIPPQQVHAVLWEKQGLANLDDSLELSKYLEFLCNETPLLFGPYANEVEDDDVIILEDSDKKSCDAFDDITQLFSHPPVTYGDDVADSTSSSDDDSDTSSAYSDTSSACSDSSSACSDSSSACSDSSSACSDTSSACSDSSSSFPNVATSSIKSMKEEIEVRQQDDNADDHVDSNVPGESNLEVIKKMTSLVEQYSSRTNAYLLPSHWFKQILNPVVILEDCMNKHRNDDALTVEVQNKANASVSSKNPLPSSDTEEDTSSSIVALSPRLCEDFLVLDKSEPISKRTRRSAFNSKNNKRSVSSHKSNSYEYGAFVARLHASHTGSSFSKEFTGNEKTNPPSRRDDNVDPSSKPKTILPKLSDDTRPSQLPVLPLKVVNSTLKLGSDIVRPVEKSGRKILKVTSHCDDDSDGSQFSESEEIDEDDEDEWLPPSKRRCFRDKFLDSKFHKPPRNHVFRFINLPQQRKPVSKNLICSDSQFDSYKPKHLKTTQDSNSQCKSKTVVATKKFHRIDKNNVRTGLSREDADSGCGDCCSVTSVSTTDCKLSVSGMAPVFNVATSLTSLRSTITISSKHSDHFPTSSKVTPPDDLDEWLDEIISSSSTVPVQKSSSDTNSSKLNDLSEIEDLLAYAI